VWLFGTLLVALNHSYTEKADVYSFGILLWEMLALEMPYVGLSDHDIERKVFHCGGRPKIDGKWPNAIRRLLHDCFASAPRRPQMTAVCDILRKEIMELGGKTLVDEDMMDSARSAMSERNFK
jgi:serine/threonine protein kinase